ncbi:hypothetical protein C5167_024196 [Papaver somniferum]|uniref:Uncharacterized protein n=1 Tax=Papaver somniferum TaxID=3469 RepID=A0A4Y7JRW7_PAPSO|nr:hypothetical protein C5167_024196 [Papaver somniferum]
MNGSSSGFRRLDLPNFESAVRVMGCEDDGVDMELIGVGKLVVSDDDGDVTRIYKDKDHIEVEFTASLFVLMALFMVGVSRSSSC